MARIELRSRHDSGERTSFSLPADRFAPPVHVRDDIRVARNTRGDGQASRVPAAVVPGEHHGRHHRRAATDAAG